MGAQLYWIFWGVSSIWILTVLGCTSVPPLHQKALVAEPSLSLGLRSSPPTEAAISPPPPVSQAPGVSQPGWLVSANAGFTASPSEFLLSGEALYRLDRLIEMGRLRGGIGVGPLLQIGVDDDPLLIGVSGNGRFTVELPTLPQLQPFAEAGVGFLITQEEHGRRGRGRGRRNKDHTHVSGLIVLGGGADWWLTETMGVGGKTYLNIAPGPGEDFFQSFLVGVTFAF